MVGLGRLELPTSPLSGARSSHLSYRPIVAGEDFIITGEGSIARNRGLKKQCVFHTRLPDALWKTVVFTVGWRK
jgi:hypothetical protein